MQGIIINFTAQEIDKVYALAKARYESNRKAKNPVIKMTEHLSDLPYFGDVVGLLGELAVAKHFNLESSTKFLYNQAEFTRIKHSVNDVGGFEVRASHYRTGCLVIHPKDLERNYQTPFIFVSVDLNRRRARIVGWITPEEAELKGEWREYFTRDLYVKQEFLKNLKDLKKYRTPA
jgi:hypothetical protein